MKGMDESPTHSRRLDLKDASVHVQSRYTELFGDCKDLCSSCQFTGGFLNPSGGGWCLRSGKTMGTPTYGLKVTSGRQLVGDTNRYDWTRSCPPTCQKDLTFCNVRTPTLDLHRGLVTGVPSRQVVTYCRVSDHPLWTSDPCHRTLGLPFVKEKPSERDTEGNSDWSRRGR